MGYVAGEEEPFEQSVREIARWDARLRDRPIDLLKVLTAADILRARRREPDRHHLRLPECGDDGQRRRAGSRSSPTSACASSSSPTIPANSARRRLDGAGESRPHRRSAARWSSGSTPPGSWSISRTAASAPASRPPEPRASRSRSTIPAAARSSTCRATRPTRSCAWSPSAAASSASTSCRSSTRAASPRADDVVAHIEHAVNVCGEDHVGIGTDGGTTGVDDMAAYRAAIREEIAERRAAGIGAARRESRHPALRRGSARDPASSAG